MHYDCVVVTLCIALLVLAEREQLEIKERGGKDISTVVGVL